MRVNNFLSSLPNNVVPYTVFTASMVLPVVMASKDQLLCSVSTVMFCQLALGVMCVGLDLIGKKFGNTSSLSRFLDQPIESLHLNRYIQPIGGNAIHELAAPAA